MSVRDTLRLLDLGSSVAEYDDALERYFVETETFRALISGAKDIIAGDKGTGKTALYRILKERYRSFPELVSAGVEVIPAFNPSGTPVFQRLGEQGLTMTEDGYRGVWKAYLLSLVGNWILELAEGDFTDDMRQLDRLLAASGLRSLDNEPRTIFSQLVNKVQGIFNRTSAAEASVELTESGLPIVGTRLEFGAPDPSTEAISRHDDALRLLNRILEDWDTTAWVVLDRLDEAFQGRPGVEKPALRALLRTYLDIEDFPRLKLKLFLRRDLFARVTTGFVNLTHINARRVDITWDTDDLFSLLDKRFSENVAFTAAVGVPPEEEWTLYSVFPSHVDAGTRKPNTWNWMMARVRDGNDVRPPRNLIDLVLKARDAQLRREEREPRGHQAGLPLIQSDSLKRGLEALSAQRVEDTLLAEAGEIAPDIEKFRGGKAEHNDASLKELLGVDWSETVKLLKTWGFLEQTGSTYKVPILYRSGLGMTQGKAFTTVAPPEAEDSEAREDPAVAPKQARTGTSERVAGVTQAPEQP